MTPKIYDLEQESLSKLNSQREKFEKRWTVLNNIFCNININNLKKMENLG